MGAVAFAIGLKLLVPTPGKNGLRAVGHYRMTLSFTGRKRLRKNFGKIQEIAQMPNLIEVQRTSYDQFLQLAKGDGRKDEGLEAVFRQVFPIKDFSESSLLDYVDYPFEDPK